MDTGLLPASNTISAKKYIKNMIGV
jgi:hypothetical protein